MSDTELITTPESPLSRCVYSDRHLSIPDDLIFDDWLEVVERLKHIQEASAWWLGDALVYGEQKFGESYAQIADATNRSVSGISLAVTVAKAFPPDERSFDLSYTHYAEVAYNEPAMASKLLGEAEREGWSAQDLRRQSRNAKIQKNLPPHSSEEKKKIHVAYADWGAVAFRLKQYAEEHPVIAERIYTFVMEIESLLQVSLRHGKITETEDRGTAEGMAGSVVNNGNQQSVNLQAGNSDMPELRADGDGTSLVAGDSSSLSGVREEPAGGSSETEASDN